jgi:hypothetical protein
VTTLVVVEIETLTIYSVVLTKLTVGTRLIAVVGTTLIAVVGTRLMTVTRSVMVLLTVTVDAGWETVGPGIVIFIPGSVMVLISDCAS